MQTGHLKRRAYLTLCNLCTGLDIAQQEDMLSNGHPVAWDTERTSDMQMIWSHVEASDARV